jgi:hypothetical protein
MNHSSLQIRKGYSVVVKIRKGCLVNITKKFRYVIDTYHNSGESGSEYLYLYAKP